MIGGSMMLGGRYVEYLRTLAQSVELKFFDSEVR